MLVQDADLLSHLRIIKDFYLLGRGELYLAFIDQSQHLLRVPATANTEHGKTFSVFCLFYIGIICVSVTNLIIAPDKKEYPNKYIQINKLIIQFFFAILYNEYCYQGEEPNKQIAFVPIL